MLDSLLDSLGAKLGVFSFGAVAGFAAGYAVKKVGRLALFAIGGLFVIVQGLAYAGWIQVDWARVASQVDPMLERSALAQAWNAMVAFLTYSMPFGAAFVPGFVAGLRYG